MENVVMLEEIPNTSRPASLPELIRPDSERILGRRRFLGGAALAGLVAAAAGSGAAIARPAVAEPAPHASGSLAVNVCDFGALGNSRKDNTAAFQKALDHVHARGGGIAAVPAGRYLFKGHLTLPAQTTLQGVFHAPPAFVRNSGTVLWPTEGRGKPDGHPFLTSNGDNVTIRGLGIYYPEQDVQAAAPAPYPWTIQHATGDNLAVLDVALTNPYQGMHLVLAGRHYIARVYGQPLLTGIYVDQCYDIGRIENIHFWPFWANGNSRLWKWVNQHGTGIRIARSDWEYVFNTFVLGYNIGYHFAQSPHGACNGNFVGLGSDASGQAAVPAGTRCARAELRSRSAGQLPCLDPAARRAVSRSPGTWGASTPPAAFEVPEQPDGGGASRRDLFAAVPPRRLAELPRQRRNQGPDGLEGQTPPGLVPGCQWPARRTASPAGGHQRPEFRRS
jgi:hypothetical protein